MCSWAHARASRRIHDLFSEVGLVFFDTISNYFEGASGQSISRHGHSKDHRPDLRQMVVGGALDVEGRPICSEMWPGNTTDATSLLPVAERMRAKFRVREMCVVADRRMVSQATLEALGAMDPPVHYIVGVRMRRTREVGEVVLKSRARWQEVTPGSSAAWTTSNKSNSPTKAAAFSFAVNLRAMLSKPFALPKSPSRPSWRKSPKASGSPAGIQM